MGQTFQGWLRSFFYSNSYYKYNLLDIGIHYFQTINLKVVLLCLFFFFFLQEKNIFSYHFEYGKKRCQRQTACSASYCLESNCLYVTEVLFFLGWKWFMFFVCFVFRTETLSWGREKCKLVLNWLIVLFASTSSAYLKTIDEKKSCLFLSLKWQ